MADPLYTAEQHAAAQLLRTRLSAVGAVDGAAAWEAVRDFGLFGVIVPPQFGGAGARPDDLALLLEEVGYAGLDTRVRDTAVFGGVAARAGHRWPAAAPFAALAAGQAVLVVGAPSQPELQSLELDPYSLTWSHDHLQLTRLDDSDEDQSVITADLAADGHDLLEAYGAWAGACVLNGISARLLDETIAYVSQRRQFGRPIGSRQAVRHELAEVAVGLDLARAAAWNAAHELARESAPGSSAWAAKVTANQAGRRANRAALQFHGGIGFTAELPLSRWLRYGLAAEQDFGGTPILLERLAATLHA